MTTGTIEIITLTPSEGMVLTQAAEVADKDRVFSDKIYLGVNDLPQNWKEVSEADADAFVAKRREALESESDSESKDMAEPGE